MIIHNKILQISRMFATDKRDLLAYKFGDLKLL